MVYRSSLLSAAALIGSSCAQSFSFPALTGKYQVASVDIEVAVTPRNISNYTYTNSSNPAFLLETVLFTTYYPTNIGAKTSAKPHQWIPPPLDLDAIGFSAYSSYGSNKTIDPSLITLGLSQLTQNITVPAVVDANLTTPNNGKTPVILFSHGDGATAYWYSELLAQLASYGYFVASIQHRDGSSFGSQMLKSDGSLIRNVTYILPDMIQPTVNFTELKNVERVFRAAEAFEIIKVLQNITNGGGDSIYKANPRKEGQDLKNWGGKLDMDRLILSGHSFGGATALDVLEQAKNNSAKVYGAMLFDPARSSGLLPSTPPVPILISDSQEWSSGAGGFSSDHFNAMKGYAQSALNNSLAGWFMTLVGTAHISITDAPLLPSTLASFFPSSSFNATIDAYNATKQYHRVTTEFLEYIQNGTVQDILMAPAAYPQWNQPNKTAVDATAKNVTDFWQVHVAPAQGANLTLPGGAENTSSTNNNNNNNSNDKPKGNAAAPTLSARWTAVGSGAILTAMTIFM